MNNYKLLQAELKQYNISVIDYDFKDIESFTIKSDNQYIIAINKNKNFTDLERYWIIEHELEHIKNGTFYNLNSSASTVNGLETKTNDALIKKLSLDKKYILELIENGTNENISQKLNLTNEILEKIKNYIDRQCLKIYHNAITIERRMSGMKNRALLLCLKNGVTTAEEYALKVGITTDMALAILNEEAVTIDPNVVKRSCEIFKVTPEYFLCIADN